MKWLIPSLMILAGIGLFAGGAIYGVVMVGVRTPDATPAIASQESRDTRISGILMGIGLIVKFVGFVALMGVILIDVLRRYNTPQSTINP